MKYDVKRFSKLVLRICITAVLLWFVLSRIDLKQFREVAKEAKWFYLFIVLGLGVVSFWIRAVKMQIILRKQQCDVGIGTVFGANAVTALYSLILPGLLSTTVKWYILKRNTGKGSNVFSSMVYNQVTEMAVRILVGLIAILLTYPGNGLKIPVLCGILSAFIIVGSVLILNRWAGEKIFIAAGYALRPFPEVIRAKTEKILEQIRVFQTAGWAFHLLIFAITLLGAALGAVIYIFAARAASIDVSPVVLVWQSSVVFVLSRLPISIANLGVREITLIEFLALYGVEAPAALLMSMIIFSVNILIGLIGCGFQICWMVGAKTAEERN